MPTLNTRRRGRSFNLTAKNKRRRHKTRRIIRSLEPNKNVNSEAIGKGGYGVVSRPPQMCGRSLNNNSKKMDIFRRKYLGNPAYISKLTENLSAELELEIGIFVKEKIPVYRDYFCFIEFLCEAPFEKHMKRGYNTYNTYAIAPYCGIPLEDYLPIENSNSPIIHTNYGNNYNINIGPKSRPIYNIFEMCYLIPACQKLLGGLILLHSIKIYHKDIHTGNILWDYDTGLLRFIDFGLAENLNRIKDDDNPTLFMAEIYDLDMMMKNVITPLINFILDSDITKMSRHKYSYVDEFCENLRDFKNSIKQQKIEYRQKKDNTLKDRLELELNFINQFRQIPSLVEIAMTYNIPNENL